MSDKSMPRKPIERALRRIISEMIDIQEQGFGHHTNWYALDRIAAIRDMCDKLLSHDELACVEGYGTESEEDAIDFDRPVDIEL